MVEDDVFTCDLCVEYPYDVEVLNARKVDLGRSLQG